jgi:SulP family sulfate permease
VGLNLSATGVKIVGEVPSGLPGFSMPDFSSGTLESLLPIALAIALVSFMESIAVAKAIQSKHKDYKIIPNQELIGLGLANVGGSFLQSYPVTGGFSRTAVNDQAGAKTGLAAIISACLIILTLLFLTPLFYYLPKAVLASVIMVAVFGLIDFQEAKHLWHANRSDFWMLAVTFIATLSLGIEQGIGIGVILSLAMIIFRTTRPHVAELGRVPNSHFYRNVKRFEAVENRKDLLILRFDAQLYFANSGYFRDMVDEYYNERKACLTTIIFNFDSINNMDSSAAAMLQELLIDYKLLGINILFTGVKGPVRDAMEKNHLIEKIGSDNFFMSIQEAVNCIDNKNRKRVFQDYTLQTND